MRALRAAWRQSSAPVDKMKLTGGENAEMWAKLVKTLKLVCDAKCKV